MSKSNNHVATIEPRPPLIAGARPTAIVPTDMESAYRLASAVCKAGMAPKGLDTPEKALIAILHGLEIGMNPMAALQRIAVVNGRPTIWGDAAMALVRGSGACEFVRERIEGEGDKQVAICEAKRKGESEPILGRFSVADAKTAGLWGKAGPWQQYPKRMLQMRARAFALRDGFADVLGGLYLREEIEDAAPTAPRRAPPPETPTIEHAPMQESEQGIEAAAVQIAQRRAPPPPVADSEDATAEDMIDPDKIRARFEEAARKARDNDELGAAWDEIVEPFVDEMFPGDLSDCDRIYRMRKSELE